MIKRLMYPGYRRYSANRHWLTRRFTQGGLIALTGLATTGILGVDTNLTVAHQGFLFLLFLIVMAVFASVFIRVKFEVERQLPRFGSAGVRLHYGVRFHNRKNEPQRNLVYLERLFDPRPTLSEFLNTPEEGEEKRNWYDRTLGFYRWTWLLQTKLMGRPAELDLPTVPPRGTIEFEASLTPLRRGVLRFEGVTVAVADPFGLFRSVSRLKLPQSILILPKRYPVPSFPLPGSVKYQQGGVAMAASVGESEEFVSVRDYRSGDPMRHIHWRSWARLGRPIVKEFQEEYFVRHALVLDTFSESVHSDVFEEAVSVAASFACSTATQDSLLDLMFVGPQAYCFTSGRGLAHADQMLEILAAVEVCRDKPFDWLERVVLDHGGSVSGCIFVLLAWDEPRQRLVKKLRMLSVPVLILVVVGRGQSMDLDPGPLRDQPEQFHVLEAGKVEEALARL